MKKKAFTLIELIAVLVILAILALIVTPLVMNIIRKARVSADKRSIDAYGRSVELAIANGGVGTANNHVNMYVAQDTTLDYYQQAYNYNGYGGMQYYLNETCNAYGYTSGCINDYSLSEVKYVVDA